MQVGQTSSRTPRWTLGPPPADPCSSHLAMCHLRWWPTDLRQGSLSTFCFCIPDPLCLRLRTLHLHPLALISSVQRWPCLRSLALILPIIRILWPRLTHWVLLATLHLLRWPFVPTWWEMGGMNPVCSCSVTIGCRCYFPLLWFTLSLMLIQVQLCFHRYHLRWLFLCVLDWIYPKKKLDQNVWISHHRSLQLLELFGNFHRWN